MRALGSTMRPSMPTPSTRMKRQKHKQLEEERPIFDKINQYLRAIKSTRGHVNFEGPMIKNHLQALTKKLLETREHIKATKQKERKHQLIIQLSIGVDYAKVLERAQRLIKATLQHKISLEQQFYTDLEEDHGGKRGQGP